MPQDNASVIVKRDTKSVIDQTPKVNGQMLWTTDIGQDNHIYTDVIDPSDNTVKRIQIGGISPETEQAIQQAVTDASASASSASTSATNASNSATELKVPMKLAVLVAIEELTKHFAKDGKELVKARRIIERINQLTDDMSLLSKNLRK